MKKYFGTDGIRGRAYEVLTPELAYQVGLSLQLLGCKEVIVGRDTRESGVMLAEGIENGAVDAGIDVYQAGVVTTPMLSYLSKRKGTFGVMLSGSHNPYHDNGIKIFKYGKKLSPEEENVIELFLNSFGTVNLEEKGKACALTDGFEIYKELYDKLNVHTNLKIGFDFSNGSACEIGEKIIQNLGCYYLTTGNNPDGLNINQGCGSMHPHNLVNLVRKNGLDLGFTFDGDADRVLACDGEGMIYNGDQLIYIYARYLLEKDALVGRGIVLTKMSNLGLFKKLGEMGVGVEVTDVGDKYVFEALERTGYVLGGENSGHIINLHLLDTGDGLLNAAYLLKILSEKKLMLKEAAQGLKMYPEKTYNLRDVNKSVLKHPEVEAGIEELKARLGENGKIVVRPSGTEPVIRIAVSAESTEEADLYAVQIIELLKEKSREVL